MIQMRMGQQYVIDAGNIKAERFGVFLVQLAAALIQPAVDQNPLAGAFDQMTGARNAAIRTMEGYFQVTLLCIRKSRLDWHVHVWIDRQASIMMRRAKAHRSHRASARYRSIFPGPSRRTRTVLDPQNR